MVGNATLTLEQVKLLPPLHLLTYRDVVADIAKDIEVATKIPYLVPIAQSAHESRNGNSGLARKHGNLFGIVATDKWKRSGGLIADMATDEQYRTKDPVKFREHYSKYDPTLIGTHTEKTDTGEAVTIYNFKITLHREFRKYRTWRDSFFDWSRLLTGLSIYKPALDLLVNPLTVKDGIIEMGKIYATDIDYAKQVLAVYEALLKA